MVLQSVKTSESLQLMLLPFWTQLQSSKCLAGRNVLYDSFESVVCLISDQKSL